MQIADMNETSIDREMKDISGAMLTRTSTKQDETRYQELQSARRNRLVRLPQSRLCR